jgi:hypothetical protein
LSRAPILEWHRMWNLGHCVREVDRSHHQVVVEETATTGAVFLIGGVACLELIVTRDRTGLVLALALAAIALFASVRSSFIADRDRRVLLVRRRILLWTFERAYEASGVERVYVRYTAKGSGLAVRFRSGRSKSLTMSLGSTARLEGIAGALNHFLYMSKESR